MHCSRERLEVNTVFGPGYAHAYDALYREKDYAAESALIQHLFRQYHEGDSIHTVLDLGCGTGSHALALGQAGYQVVGVDCSGDMLAEARRKAVELGCHEAVFHRADIRHLTLRQLFDAGIMMF